MKKKRTIIFLCIILLLAAAFCLTAFRVRGSVSVKGDGSTQSPDPVFFSQKDPLWAEICWETPPLPWKPPDA